MSHSVAEAAARAVAKGDKKAAQKPIFERTPEERIANIRSLLAANLSVPQSEIRFLLELYDTAYDVLRMHDAAQ